VSVASDLTCIELCFRISHKTFVSNLFCVGGFIYRPSNRCLLTFTADSDTGNKTALTQIYAKPGKI